MKIVNDFPSISIDLNQKYKKYSKYLTKNKQRNELFNI